MENRYLKLDSRKYISPLTILFPLTLILNIFSLEFSSLNLSICHVELGKSLIISLNCSGILKFSSSLKMSFINFKSRVFNAFSRVFLISTFVFWVIANFGEMR